MLDILRIILVFAAILLLLRLKWNIGPVMVVASILLFILYLVPLPVVFTTVKTAVADPVTVKLFFALTLIRVLELILREQNVMKMMMEVSQKILKKRRAVIVSMPLLIGLLPSLGGAYFSAPMVEESTRGLAMSPEEKGFINYWFRHPWEFILPLYPGILLASAIANIELRSFILANTPYALLIAGTGFLFSMRGMNDRDGAEGPETGEGGNDAPVFGSGAIWNFLPIVFILVLVMGFHMELHYALGITITVLFFHFRLGAKEIFRVMKYGFTPDVFVLIFGTMLFKFAMESSGAVEHLNRFFTESGIPLLPVLFMLPFVSGLLTGLTVGFVGSTFPLIISLTGGAHLGQLSFAFASGFIGVLLSPVHLCLVLTREYFKADAWGIYRKTLRASGIVMVAALIEYLIL
ncbi:MAG TPA: DUF401 family protein [Thermodesulfovibrionales bacterium]|nr:DUF401 family protein [Thermodesulfovibrionales bacterium]